MIELHDVTKLYGQRQILDTVNAHFQKASTTLLTGPNGSGKTTLLKLIAGLIQPTSGDILITPSSNNPPSIAYVAHQTFLYPNLTAFENLRFWSRCYGCSSEEESIFAVLKSVNLLHCADEPTRSFSRGMCQRLNLARALLNKPTVLLLDEPFTGLDELSREGLSKAICAAREEGACCIMITHDLDKDYPLADRILRLEHGQLLTVQQI